MESGQEHIKELWQLYLTDQASPEQVAALFEFISQQKNDDLNGEYFRELSQEAVLPGEGTDPQLAAAVLRSIIDQHPELKKLLHPEEEPRPATKIRILKPVLLRYVAAVALLIIGLAAWYFLRDSRTSVEPQLTKNEAPASRQVLPGNDKAVLTLSDGRNITMNNNSSGSIATDGNTEIVQSGDGQLVYKIQGQSSGEILWNTMTTPRGGQYQLTLPDGSRVWLNAASSITYPVAFTGPERNVKISGEAYFEVFKNKEKPFKVQINDQTTVEVLGTHFNVNSYKDDGHTRITLLEGSVKVQDPAAAVVIKPGQQATTGEKGISVRSEIDVEQVMAWKNGIFNFNNTDLTQVMKQLERWYDIGIKYEGSIPSIRLKGEMDRGVQLADVQKFLSSYGISNKLENRTLIISGK